MESWSAAGTSRNRIDAGNSPRTSHVAIRQNYTGMVENIDGWWACFLEELKKRGEMENTLVVYSSDHGENAGRPYRWARCCRTRQRQRADGDCRRVSAMACQRRTGQSHGSGGHLPQYASRRPSPPIWTAGREGSSKADKETSRRGSKRPGELAHGIHGRHKLIRGFNPEASSADRTMRPRRRTGRSDSVRSEGRSPQRTSTWQRSRASMWRGCRVTCSAARSIVPRCTGIMNLDEPAASSDLPPMLTPIVKLRS